MVTKTVNLGTSFGEFRSRFGLSQAQCAYLFDVTDRTWGNWEQAANAPYAAQVVLDIILAAPDDEDWRTLVLASVTKPTDITLEDVIRKAVA